MSWYCQRHFTLSTILHCSWYSWVTSNNNRVIQCLGKGLWRFLEATDYKPLWTILMLRVVVTGGKQLTSSYSLCGETMKNMCVHLNLIKHLPASSSLSMFETSGKQISKNRLLICLMKKCKCFFFLMLYYNAKLKYLPQACLGA